MTPGAKFSDTTLLAAISRSTSPRPLSVRRLTVTPSLLRQ
jgi:hypothetical protein